MAWAMCTESVQGFERLRFSFTDDGRWTADIGRRRVTATTRLEGTVVGT